MNRLFVDVLDAEGKARTVRAVDAREIVELGGQFVNADEERLVGEKKEKKRESDPLNANKGKGSKK